MPKESDILYENGDYWVMRTPKGGYDIYKSSPTHSTRCAQIGYKGEEGFSRAKNEIDRRIKNDAERLESHRRSATETTNRA